MTPAAVALAHAERRLVERLEQLAARVDAADEAAWDEYSRTAAALAAIAKETAPGAHGELLTTRELADRLRLSPKVVRRKAARGELGGVERIQLARRGPGALRWRA